MAAVSDQIDFKGILGEQSNFYIDRCRFWLGQARKAFLRSTKRQRCSFASLERFRIRCRWEDSIELKWSRQETLDDYVTQHSDVLTGLLTFLGVILKLIATKRHERCVVWVECYCI